MILLLRQDFANLGQHLKGRLVLPVDAHPDPILRLLQGRQGVDDVLPLGFTRGPRNPCAAYLEVAIDTESVSLHGAPWCLSFSLDPYHGYVILSTDHEALHRFAQWLQWQHPVVLLHHSLHDIPVLRAMGLTIPRYRDTMVDAYHLANVPQGLKALGWRLLGVRMRSFEDTVLPHSMPVAMDYLARANDALSPALTFQHQLKAGPRKGQWESRTLPGADKLAVATWRKVQKCLREDGADPWRRWTGWHPHDRALLQGVLGSPLPFPSIVHVPLADAVSYAALDAVVTLRIHRILRCKRVVL